MPLAVTFGGVGIMRLMLGASALFIVSLRKQTTFFQFRDGLQHAHIQCSNGIVRNDAYFHVHIQISSFDVTIEGVCIGKQQRAVGSIFGF